MIDISSIDMYILRESISSELFSKVISIFLIYTYEFKDFCVPVNFIIGSVWFRKICDEMILRSTSEARIWFLTVTLITLIIRVAWINDKLISLSCQVVKARRSGSQY